MEPNSAEERRIKRELRDCKMYGMAAAAFYERNGFEKIPGMERMFVPLKSRDG